MADMIYVLIGLNLVALLGVVVSVPYPTNLIGSDPGSRVAVIIFISVFIILSLLYLLISVRVQAVKAWIKPVSVNHFNWMLARWGGGDYGVAGRPGSVILVSPEWADHSCCKYGIRPAGIAPYLHGIKKAGF